MFLFFSCSWEKWVFLQVRGVARAFQTIKARREGGGTRNGTDSQNHGTDPYDRGVSQ